MIVKVLVVVIMMQVARRIGQLPVVMLRPLVGLHLRRVLRPPVAVRMIVTDVFLAVGFRLMRGPMQMMLQMVQALRVEQRGR